MQSLASLHQVVSQILVIEKSRHSNTQLLKHLDEIMLNLSPKRKILSCLRTLLGKMSDILLRSHIHAVVVLPVRIIFVGKVNNLASNVLTYGTINEVGKLSHLIFATQKHFHTLMTYLLMQHSSLCLVGISTVR